MVIVLIVLIIAAIPLMVALFVKKDYTVEREIKIERPNQVVFDYIRYLKNHDHFNKWSKLDPHVIRQYYGSDGTAGFLSTWNSKKKKVGKGEQQIIKVSVPKRVEIEWRFIKPCPGVVRIYMTTDPTSRNETIVSWGIAGKMNYPVNLVLLFNVQKAIGKHMEKGLEIIRQQLENKQ